MLSTDGRPDADWSTEGRVDTRSSDGRDALRLIARSTDGRAGSGRPSYDCRASFCEDGPSYCEDARPYILRSSCEKRAKPRASSGDSGRSCVGRGRSGVPRRSGVLRPMAGGGVGVDLGAAFAGGFFWGERMSSSCFSRSAASAKRAARSLMFFAFMGVGDGRSLYWMMVLTGRLFPSTTFSWTTAWKPFGPSIGVRTGSS